MGPGYVHPLDKPGATAGRSLAAEAAAPPSEERPPSSKGPDRKVELEPLGAGATTEKPHS